jgi:hypothetical protein
MRRKIKFSAFFAFKKSLKFTTIAYPSPCVCLLEQKYDEDQQQQNTKKNFITSMNERP